MGSFNFKESPFYQQKTPQFIGQVSRNILPLKEQYDQKGTDVRELPLTRKLSKIQGKLGFPLSALGLLRVRHPHSNNIIDGTCVLISPKILLTCAHNLYSYQDKTYYKELDYFPSRNGLQTSKITIKISRQTVKIHPNFYQYETLQHEHFDYGIIMLQQSMKDVCGCLEVAPNYKLKDDDIYLFGYPVQKNNIKQEVNLYGVKGKVVRPIQQILYYDMETAAGQSGSPILVQKQRKWMIVGIHTISDPSGVYINSNVAATLNSWINLQQSTLAIEDGSKVFGDKAPKLQKMVCKYTWESLISLTFNNCNITSDNLTNLNKLSWNIRSLILDNNKIDCICLNSAKFKQLQKLYLNNNMITKIDSTINDFNKLYLLSLKNNRIAKVNVKITSNIMGILLHGNKCEFAEDIDKKIFQF